MSSILADIFNQRQHFSALSLTPEQYCPRNCPHCYKNSLWKHGVYYRQAQFVNDGHSVPIPRFFCLSCRHTCSTLPEYISPRRWYYWVVQQAVLILIMMGKPVQVVCDELSHQLLHIPSINTIYRWHRQLKTQFLVHQFYLCNLYPSLRFESSCEQFWLTYFEHEGGLSRAMIDLHRANQQVP